MNNRYDNILITGATGSLGKQLLAELIRQGIKPIAHCRQSSNQDRIKPFGVEIRVADLRNTDQLRDLVQGVDAVIHTAATVNFRGDRLTQFTGINTMGAVQLYKEAKEAGVKRFVQVSSIAAVGAVLRKEPSQPLTEQSPFNLGHLNIPYVLSKRAAELELAKIADSSSPELIIVNPSIMIAPSRSGDDRSKALKLLSRPLIPVVKNRLNLVDIRDAITGIINALWQGTPGQRYLLTGDNIQFDQLLHLIGQKLERKPRTIPLPKWLPMTAAHINVLGRIISNRPIRRLYPDLIRMLDYDWIYDASRAKREIDFTPRPLSETLDDLLNNRMKVPSDLITG